MNREMKNHLNYLFVIILFFINLSCFSLSQKVFNGEHWISIPLSSGSKPPPLNDNIWQSTEVEIFVAVTHYRDMRCPVTLRNIFLKALYPYRIRVGLVTQVHTEDDKTRCLEAYCQLVGKPIDSGKCPYLDQIKTIEFTFQEARGSSYGRHLQEYLLEDEEFCMEIDSHTDFIKNWDVEMLSMWGSIDNEYAILSTYPDDLSNLGKNVNNRWEVPHVCAATFTKNGMIRSLKGLKAKELDKPLMAPLWSSQFSFSKCHALKKTPYDPNFNYLIDGIDFSRFARLWTRGYDVYSLSKVIVAHDTKEKMMEISPEMLAPGLVPEGGKINAFGWMTKGMTNEYIRQIYETSQFRMFTLLGMPNGVKDVETIASIGEYGLGNKRTLDQLIAFTGIDTRSTSIIGCRCKGLEWVPFTPDIDPKVIDNDIWGFGPEINFKGQSNIPLLNADIEIFQQRDGLSSNELKDSRLFDKEKYIPDSETGELWAIFQSIDMMVDGFIDSVDAAVDGNDDKFHHGHGHRVLKLILLGAPIFFLVVYAAIFIQNKDIESDYESEKFRE